MNPKLCVIENLHAENATAMPIDSAVFWTLSCAHMGGTEFWSRYSESLDIFRASVSISVKKRTVFTAACQRCTSQSCAFKTCISPPSVAVSSSSVVQAHMPNYCFSSLPLDKRLYLPEEDGMPKE